MNDILYRKVQGKLISSITEAQRHLDTLIRMEKEEELRRIEKQNPIFLREIYMKCLESFSHSILRDIRGFIFRPPHKIGRINIEYSYDKALINPSSIDSFILFRPGLWSLWDILTLGKYKRAKFKSK